VVRAFAKTGRLLKTMKQLNTAAEVIPVTCPEDSLSITHQQFVGVNIQNALCNNKNSQKKWSL
jgi:hypothetical protein